MSKTVLVPHTYSFLPPAAPPDVQAVARQAAKDHKPDTKLYLRELPSLTQQRQSLVAGLPIESSSSLGRPIVAELRRKTENAIEELSTLTAAANSGEFNGLRAEVDQKKREADRLETAWTGESKALEVAERILTQTEKLLKEFDSGPNGDRLKKLRKMDAAIDSSRPSTHRARHRSRSSLGRRSGSH